MPIYQYKPVKKCLGQCKNGFDLIQSMQDKVLTQCPQCGAPVKKVPALCAGGVQMLSDGHLRDKGFTKLVKKDKGVYEKTT